MARRRRAGTRRKEQHPRDRLQRLRTLRLRPDIRRQAPSDSHARRNVRGQQQREPHQRRLQVLQGRPARNRNPAGRERPAFARRPAPIAADGPLRIGLLHLRQPLYDPCGRPRRLYVPLRQQSGRHGPLSVGVGGVEHRGGAFHAARRSDLCTDAARRLGTFGTSGARSLPLQRKLHYGNRPRHHHRERHHQLLRRTLDRPERRMERRTGSRAVQRPDSAHGELLRFQKRRQTALLLPQAHRRL